MESKMLWKLLCMYRMANTEFSQLTSDINLGNKIKEHEKEIKTYYVVNCQTTEQIQVYIHIYVYVYACVYICVCVCLLEPNSKLKPLT